MLRITLLTCCVVASGVLACAAHGGQVTIETVRVLRAQNPADANGLGNVDVVFRIGRFEIINPQYVTFLNAVADADPNGLYDQLMTTSDRGGILRSGPAGTYSYFVKANFFNKPVVAIDWLDAARFCNWLHNGQPNGPQSPSTTEDGAYDLSLPIDQIVRKPGARWFIPTHSEWYKAAYYDPFNPAADAGGTVDYWLYPTRSDIEPAQATANAQGDVANPGLNIANHSRGVNWNGENGNVTNVGGCTALSPWGALDMGGNMHEWTETLGVPIAPDPPKFPDPRPTRRIRGGDFANTGFLMASHAFLASSLNMVAAGANIGFRVARVGGIAGDLNEDGRVDIIDLFMLLSVWGPCAQPCPAYCDADLSSADGLLPDCNIDIFDLFVLLSNWG